MSNLTALALHPCLNFTGSHPLGFNHMQVGQGGVAAAPGIGDTDLFTDKDGLEALQAILDMVEESEAEAALPITGNAPNPIFTAASYPLNAAGSFEHSLPKVSTEQTARKPEPAVKKCYSLKGASASVAASKTKAIGKKVPRKNTAKPVSSAAKANKVASPQLQKKAAKANPKKSVNKVCWTKEEEKKFVQLHRTTKKGTNYYSRIRSAMIAAGFPDRKNKEYRNKWMRELKPDLRRLKINEWTERDVEDLKEHIREHGRKKWAIFREKTNIPDHLARFMSLSKHHNLKDVEAGVS